MNNKKRILVLSLLGILIILVITLGIARAFMNPIMPSDSVTEVSLSSCAKITLLDSESSINLINTAPMSDNRGLNTTPYEFTIKSSCEESIKYKVYLGALSNSTLDASKIKYAIKEKESDDIVATGNLETIGNNDFTSDEINQIKSGVGTTSNIYTIMENIVVHESSTEYQLYLWVSSEAGNEVMDKTFTAGVIVKGYESVELFAEYIKSLYTTQGENGLYLHDETLENGANDGSLRYSGGRYEIADRYQTQYANINDTDADANGIIKSYCSRGEEYSYIGKPCPSSKNTLYYYLTYNPNVHYDNYPEALNQAREDGYVVPLVNNFVCFGSDEEKCPYENLYRVIGVFDNRVKLIKADYGSKELLGTDGEYYSNSFTIVPSLAIRYKGYSNIIDLYEWNKKENGKIINGINNLDIWRYSELNTINLNTNFLNNIGEKWANRIAKSVWHVGGLEYSKIQSNAKTIYDYEVGNNRFKEGQVYNLIYSNNNPFDYTANNTIYNSKIGLMYASDYLFGANPEYWTYPANSNTSLDENGKYGNYRDSWESNWLYFGKLEATLTSIKYSSPFRYFVRIDYMGNLEATQVETNSPVVRPVFYLKNNIKYISGTGTELNPFRIA